MAAFPHHSKRLAVVGELHARPFQPQSAPSRVVHFALTPEPGEERDRAAESAHMAALFDHFGLERPGEDVLESVSHHAAGDDAVLIRWERHTEFISYSLSFSGAAPAPFDPGVLSALPEGWLAAAPGGVISAVLVDVAALPSIEAAEAVADSAHGDSLQRNSLAAAFVAGRQAAAFTDFMVDANGFTRLAVFALPGLGPRRLGRLTQRLLELLTYQNLALLTFPMARGLGPRLGGVDARLANVVGRIAGKGSLVDERANLDELTGIAADLERLSAETAFRFAAGRAYERIVEERLEILTLERVKNLQTLREFFIRRFRPAMRTCAAAEARMELLASRAERAANLLRTRVDVRLEEQNQGLLHSMDRRAKLQLRLQQTVEGLSVVAISYYAVSLAGILLAPLAETADRSAATLKALAAPAIILGVWLFVREIRRHVVDKDPEAAPDQKAAERPPDRS